VRRRHLPRMVAAVATLAIAVACGTGNPGSGQAPAQGGAIPPLPDLSSMAESVQQQIRAQYEGLQARQATSLSDADRARDFGTVGVLLMAAESLPVAETFLGQAIALEPANPRWSYFLGHLHRMKGDSEGAARYFEQTLALRPDDVPSLVWLGNLRLDQGQGPAAATLFDRALAQSPGLFGALFGLGRAALINGNYAEAVTRLEAASATSPRATAVNYPLAMAYRQVGRVEEAEARLRARGDAQPPMTDPLMRELAEILQSPAVYEARGDRAFARGDLPLAIDSFKQAMTLAPGRRALNQKLATALAVSGDIPGAVTLYEELLKENPNFAEAHYSLAVIQLGSGRIDLAIDRFARAVKADPTYLEAHVQLANTLRKARAFDRALSAYQGALSVDPRRVEARAGYAATLASAGRYAAARAWLTEAHKSQPNQAEFSELLVRILAAAPDDQARDGRMAVEVGEGLVRQASTWRTLEALAMALAETGRWPEAVARQREAIEAFARTGGATTALMENLRRFERHQPSRVPWSFDPV
jgi:tetratricopeptide (TPR) repeat protein